MEEEIDICPDCKVECIFTETQNSVHYGKIRCPECNRWIRWVKSLEKKGQRTKTSKFKIKQVMEFHFPFEKIKPFCFFCLRNKDILGWNETITLDHIKELNNGGEDKINNLQILCSACHKLKNWARLYMNWHLNKKE